MMNIPPNNSYELFEYWYEMNKSENDNMAIGINSSYNEDGWVPTLLDEYGDLIEKIYKSVGYDGYQGNICNYQNSYWKLASDDSEIYFGDNMDEVECYAEEIAPTRSKPKTIFTGPNHTMVITRNGDHMFFSNNKKVSYLNEQ